MRKKPPVAYRKDLNEFIDEIYARAANNKWSWSKLASRALLTQATVAKLGHRETRWPQLLTVWKLARAVGMRVSVQYVKSMKGAA
jgi:hypothetical protein